MKTLLYVLIISTFFVQPVSAKNFHLSSPKLVAYWSFDESQDSILIDSSDNGNTGFIHSGQRVSGIKGKGLSFNGTTDYAYAKNSSTLNITNTLTIECWVNVRQINPVSGAGQTFIRKEKAYALGIGSGGKIGLQICIGGGWNGGWAVSQQSIQPSQWYHIAAVWNGKIAKMYINGVQDPNTLNINGTVVSSNYDVYLGEFYESNYEKLNGILDEVRVYDDALSSDSILAHYGPNKPRPPALLIPCLPNPTYNQRPLFSWYGNKTVPVYRLQIAVTQQFSSPLISLPTTDTSYTPAVNLPFGPIYWRVGDEADAASWSSVSSLYIQDSLIPILIPYAPDPTRIRKPVLKWRAVTNAKAYTIQLFTLPNSTTPFITNGVPDTFYSPAVDLPSATFIWRVKSDLSATFSIPDTFLIVNDSVPMLNPMAPDTQYTRRPVFSWSSADGASYYIIQIDTIGDFAQPFISTPVPDTFYSSLINLPFGKIIWRVSSNTNPAKYSNIDTFWIRANSGINQADRLKGAKDNNVSFTTLQQGIAIAYTIDEPSDISLNIYTLNGMRVMALRQRITTSGAHRLFWNGKGGNDPLLPNGSCIASFGIDKKVFTKRIITLR